MYASLNFPALGTTAVLLVEHESALDAAHAILLAEIEAIDAACSRFAPTRSSRWSTKTPAG